MTENPKLPVDMLQSRHPFLATTEAATGAAITWLPVRTLSKYRIGICERGEWAVESKEGLIVLNSAEGFRYLLALLEMPQAEVAKKLVEFSKSLGPDIDVVSAFPFREIVVAGLNQCSDYWARLAFGWYDALGDLDRKEFIYLLTNVVESKWASQATRQKARRELQLIGGGG